MPPSWWSWSMSRRVRNFLSSSSCRATAAGSGAAGGGSRSMSGGGEPPGAACIESASAAARAIISPPRIGDRPRSSRGRRSDEQQLRAFHVEGVEAERECEGRAHAAPGGFELHRYILGLLLAVQLDGPVQRGLLRLLERDRHPGDRSLHLRVRMRLLVRRLAHVLVAVRIPAVERGDPDAYLDHDGAVGLGQRAALHLVAGGADFVKPMYDRVGESAFAQVEQLPRRRRTEEE